MQHQRLAQEMQDAAVAGLIQRRPRIKASRSLPAIVMKPAPKPRVCLSVCLSVRLCLCMTMFVGDLR